MRPGVGADGVSCGGDLLENFRMIGRVLADREEHRLGAFVRQRLQHRGRGRPRTVVEGQHDLLVGQEIELLVLQEAEARSARGVDHDGAADAERIGIGAGRFCAAARRGTGGAGFDSAAVTSTSSLAAALAAAAGNGSALRAATVWGEPHRRAARRSRTKLRRSRPPQQHWPASGPTHYASLHFPAYSRAHTRRAINANKVLTPHQHDPVR